MNFQFDETFKEFEEDLHKNIEVLVAMATPLWVETSDVTSRHLGVCEGCETGTTAWEVQTEATRRVLITAIHLDSDAVTFDPETILLISQT